MALVVPGRMSLPAVLALLRHPDAFDAFLRQGGPLERVVGMAGKGRVCPICVYLKARGTPHDIYVGPREIFFIRERARRAPLPAWVQVFIAAIDQTPGRVLTALECDDLLQRVLVGEV